MAVVEDPTLEEDEQGQPVGEEQITAAPAAPSPGAAPGGGTTPTGSTPARGTPAATARRGSGRFTNLQKYLQANTQADYAGRIGQQFEQQKGEVERGIEEARAGVEAAAQPELQRLQGAQQQIQQTLAAPTQATAEQQQAFQQFRTGQTADVGRDISQQQQAAQALGKQAALVGTEPGRFELLRQTFGTPTYSRGQGRLDQLLLQGQSGQLRNLQQQAQQAAQAGQAGIEQLQQTIGGYQQQIGELGRQAQEAAQTGVTEAITGAQTGLEERAQKLQKQRQQEYQQALTGLGELGQTGYINPQLAAQLGITEGTQLFGVTGQELQSILAGTGAAGRAELPVQAGAVATEEDVSRLQALSQLAGRPEVAQFAQPREFEDVIQSISPQFESLLGAERGAAEAAYRQTQGKAGMDIGALLKRYLTEMSFGRGERTAIKAMHEFSRQAPNLTPEQSIERLQNIKQMVHRKRTGLIAGIDKAIRDIQTTLARTQSGRRITFTPPSAGSPFGAVGGPAEGFTGIQ